MRTILNLLKLQIDNKTDVLKTKSPQKMMVSLFKILLFLVVATVLLIYLEFRIFILQIKINAALIAIILLISWVISLLFAIGRVINTLYLSKDNELLITFPVTANQLFLSKILLIYIKEVSVNAMIMVPLMVGVALYGELGAAFWLSFPILLLVLPMLTVVLSSLLSILIMQVISFLKKHTALSILIMLSLVTFCLTIYIIFIGNIMESFNITTKLIETVNKINAGIMAFGSKIFIFYPLAKAMFSFKSWANIGYFFIMCVCLLIVTLIIIKPFFLKVAMSNIEKLSKVKKNKTKFKKLSPFASLVLKEIKSIFRSPSEIFEFFLFTLLMPFIVFSYDKLLMSISVNQAGVNMIAGSHLMVVAILAMLSNIISASAISKEGKNFYISKIVPVDYYTQIFAKLAFNLIFTIGAVLITMFVSFFVYPVWQIVLSTIAVIFAAVGHAAMSADMDLQNPAFEYEGDAKTSATSKSTRKSIIAGLLIGAIMGMIIILLSHLEKTYIPYLIIIFASIAFMIYRLYLLVLRINLRYKQIEM